MTSIPDVIVIGAGIAGSSLAAQLSAHCKVRLLEMENQPAYHSTGRSAAYFAPAYGNAVIRDITAASQPFFEEPPDGFTDVKLLNHRDSLFVAEKNQSIEALLQENPHLSALNNDQMTELVPILDKDKIDRGAHDSTGGDLDVDAIMQGFLRQIRAGDGELITDSKVTSLHFKSGIWTVTTSRGEFSAPVVINAAGAWADSIATLAGLKPLGIKPLRRTALLVDPPESMDISDWPLVVGINETFYFKPVANQLLISPADETPTKPCDAQPEELDIAIAIDRVSQISNLEVRKVNHSWAGLRSFAPDKTFVAGFDPNTSGFFWFAGHGGYGVQTAPALSDIACSLITGSCNLISVQEARAHADAISPNRFF